MAGRGKHAYVTFKGKEYTATELGQMYDLQTQLIIRRYRTGLRDAELVKPAFKHPPKMPKVPKPPRVKKVKAPGVRAERKRIIHEMMGAHTAEQIAAVVGIKPHAVEFHIRNLREAHGDKLAYLPALAVVKLLQGESPWALDDFLREDLLLRLREAGFPVDLGPRLNWE